MVEVPFGGLDDKVKIQAGTAQIDGRPLDVGNAVVGCSLDMLVFAGSEIAFCGCRQGTANGV